MPTVTNDSLTGVKEIGESALQLTTYSAPGAPGSGVLRPVVSLSEVRAVWNDYLELENILLDDKDYLYFVIWQVGPKEQRVACASLQAAEASKKKTRGRIERTKKKSAYRKMSVFFGLTIPRRDGVPEIEIQELSSGVIKIERGDGYIGTLYMKKPPSFDVVRAEFAITVTAPNGRSVVGHGACSASERGFTHPDHDIVATSWTRALNRAISDMIGMGEVSAEELTNVNVNVVEHVARPNHQSDQPNQPKTARLPRLRAKVTKPTAKVAVTKAVTKATETIDTTSATSATKISLPGLGPNDAEAKPNSDPRNLGEFLAIAFSGYGFTIPEIYNILDIEDFGQVEDWSAALEKVKAAKSKSKSNNGSKVVSK